MHLIIEIIKKKNNYNIYYIYYKKIINQKKNDSRSQTLTAHGSSLGQRQTAAIGNQPILSYIHIYCKKKIRRKSLLPKIFGKINK